MGEKIIGQRADHKLIVDWVEPNTKILDMGCGDGSLLERLIKEKGCHGTGIEIDEKAIYQCMEKGVTVSHGNIDTSLEDYSNKRFDYVILNESLQQILHPRRVILEALRVGKHVIIGIPNFCYWKARLQILAQGRVPVTAEMPDQWYDTPNLRFLSLKDFRDFCKKYGITIHTEKGVTEKHIVNFRPNLRAKFGLFLLSKSH